MTLTIELTPEQEARLQAEATASGLDLPEFVRLRLLKDMFEAQPQTDPTTTWNKPRTGGDLARRIDALDIAGSYGDPALDAPELARKLRQEAEARR